ncbi:MAG: hypothetical protein HYT42_01165, partial [Candidatus Sungbacteria bacterium]|nr:hypothetical protein [Candidatus Sungbacteria bacterium]
PAAETPLSPLAVSRHRSPAILDWAFPPGYYRAEYIPYYFTWTVLGSWRRVDLPKGSKSFYVGRELNADYDPIAGRHIGWFVSLNGGDIPPW